jgi:hypothetical protein
MLIVISGGDELKNSNPSPCMEELLKANSLTPTRRGDVNSIWWLKSERALLSCLKTTTTRKCAAVLSRVNDDIKFCFLTRRTQDQHRSAVEMSA